MKIFIYDLEIERGILGKNEEPLDDVLYCRGWTDYEGMGISVVGVCEIDTAVPHRPVYSVFLADNLRYLVRLAHSKADLLVGFNNIGFDDNVLDASTESDWTYYTSHIPRFDIQREIWLAQGYPTDRFDREVHAGFSLNAMCAANGLPSKTGSGAMAPVLWQRGQTARVINYCLHDVALTYALLDLIEVSRYLNAPEDKGGHQIPMRLIDRHRNVPLTSEAMPWLPAE
jgi:hypothetical protein